MAVVVAVFGACGTAIVAERQRRLDPILAAKYYNFVWLRIAQFIYKYRRMVDWKRNGLLCNDALPIDVLRKKPEHRKYLTCALAASSIVIRLCVAGFAKTASGTVAHIHKPL